MQGRIQKILSAHGVASRRAAENMIRDGRVTVNGVTALPGCSADDVRDLILVDGKPLPKAEEPVYLMLNKPAGYITTTSDDHGRQTVMHLVSDAGASVYPVGRLDMDTEGMLLMTNDGQFANSVIHPSSGITKIYEARVRGSIEAGAEMLRKPVEVDSHVVHAVSVKIKNKAGKSAVLVIEIVEGRNRQVRKMCAVCGLNVDSLKRVAIGSVELASLPPGKWRRLSAEEVTRLKKSCVNDDKL